MILQAISFLLQVLTVAFYQIEQAWTITNVNNVNITIGDVILWYLCIAAVLSIIVRLLGGIATNRKETVK